MRFFAMSGSAPEKAPSERPWRCFLTSFVLAMLMTASLSVAQEARVELPADLSDADFQAMLARLSDEQVRDLLIAEFAARSSEGTAKGDGLLASSRDIVEILTTNATALIAKLPDLGAGLGTIFTVLSEGGGVGLALLALALSVLAGGIVQRFWHRRGAARQSMIDERNMGKAAYGSVSAIMDAIFVLFIALSGSVAFAVAAMAVLYLLFHHPDIRFFASSYIAVVTVVLIARSVVDNLFPRRWPVYRLVALSDEATRRVHWVVIGLSALWMFELATSDVMARFGAPALTPDLLSLLLGLVWISMALMGTFWIDRATTELLPPVEDRSVMGILSRNWAPITMVVMLIMWGIFTGGALLVGNVDVIASLVFTTLLITLGLWVAYRVLVLYLRAQDMDSAVKRTIGKSARALLFAAGLIVNLAVWGLDPTTLAARGPIGLALVTGVNVLLTAIIGWAVWDFLRTIIDVRVAAEQPQETDADSGDAEGGLGASRTATLLPLLRSTALVIIGMICLFAALSSLGINVAPLVAGAGVIGLAIGFGAQTLVKDVVSGVFFLIDDAFRRGEYIDLGTVKGTVERISVRSLQLRHHLGAVHTIPFGDISALTNYSRDWVIMKLPLRLTFDTDPQQVKKIIKKIGAEFMEDDILGAGLIEPPKSQGVVEMEDSAMILRVKFKALPGKQFTIRRDLLHRIRAAFEEAGIRFANREVTVRVTEDATPAERREAIAAAASETSTAEQPAN